MPFDSATRITRVQNPCTRVNRQNAAWSIRRRLRDSFGWDCVVPDDRSSFALG